MTLSSVVWEKLGEVKLSLLSLMVFTAWLVASEGWVRALAIGWLVYPAVVVLRITRRRSRS